MNAGSFQTVLKWIKRYSPAMLVIFCAVRSFCATWDETRYEYDPGTGDLLKKIYPDGHQISYTYHVPSLPRRITYASGKWMERFYNERLQIVSNVYSSANTPSVHSSPNNLGTICRTENSWGLVYDYGICPYGQLLTNEVVTSPWMNWELTHAHERFDRESGWALSVGNVPKGKAHWNYDAEGRISHLACTNSVGRSIEISYTNSGLYACGYDVRTPSGAEWAKKFLDIVPHDARDGLFLACWKIDDRNLHGKLLCKFEEWLTADATWDGGDGEGAWLGRFISKWLTSGTFPYTRLEKCIRWHFKQQYRFL